MTLFRRRCTRLRRAFALAAFGVACIGQAGLAAPPDAPSPDGGQPAALPTPIRGGADREIVRRVIRRHIEEVKECYEPELAITPTPTVRIALRFTIGPSGAVSDSETEDSNVKSPRFEECVLVATRRWQFPKPLGGGSVVVSYPIAFTPDSYTLLEGDRGANALDISVVEHDLLVHRSTDSSGVPANGVIAILDGGLLLVDTAWTDEQTDAILRFGSERMHRPWIGAVITHDHADRAGGIGALLRARIPVAAGNLTVAKLEKRGVHGGKPLFAAGATEVQDPRGFVAFYPGPGHTSDNIVVAFPAWNVVFGGCLIKAANATDLGFTGDADRVAWPAAVRRVRERFPKPEAVIPGHGPFAKGDAPYRRTLDLLARELPGLAR